MKKKKQIIKRVHLLKANDKYYKLYANFDKWYSLRFNDRKYQVGDHVQIIASGNQEKQEHFISFKIIAITTSSELLGVVKKGYVILNISYACDEDVRDAIKERYKDGSVNTFIDTSSNVKIVFS